MLKKSLSYVRRDGLLFVMAVVIWLSGLLFFSWLLFKDPRCNLSSSSSFIIEDIYLSDNTRCVLIHSNTQMALDCDWSGWTQFYEDAQPPF